MQIRMPASRRGFFQSVECCILRQHTIEFREKKIKHITWTDLKKNIQNSSLILVICQYSYFEELKMCLRILMSNLICCYNLYKKCAFMLEKVYLKCFFFNSKCFCFPFRQDASLYSGNYMTIGSSGKSQRTARYFLLHQSSAPRSQAYPSEHVCTGNMYAGGISQ